MKIYASAGSLTRVLRATLGVFVSLCPIVTSPAHGDVISTIQTPPSQVIEDLSTSETLPPPIGISYAMMVASKPNGGHINDNNDDRLNRHSFPQVMQDIGKGKHIAELIDPDLDDPDLFWNSLLDDDMLKPGEEQRSRAIQDTGEQGEGRRRVDRRKVEGGGPI